jgi:hypothetical protein
MTFLTGRKVIPAIHGDFVASRGESSANFFVISFDAAVLSDHTASADEGDSQWSFPRIWRVRWLVLFYDQILFGSDQPIVDSRHRLIVKSRGVARSHKIPPPPSHRLSFFWIGTEKPQNIGQLLDVSDWIKHSGFAVPDELAPRPQIGGDHRTPLGVGLENCFAEGFVGVGWQNGVSRIPDALFQIRGAQVAYEFDILGRHPSCKRLEGCACRAFAGNHQADPRQLALARSKSSTPFSADSRPK